MNTLTLPRETVLRLLHQAQLGDGAGLLVRRPGGALDVRGVDADARTEELSRQLAARSETAFAFYRTAAQTNPETRDLSRWSGLTQLFLSVSVGTKGVLQLRAWRSTGGTAVPVELALAEESEAQSSGVSR